MHARTRMSRGFSLVEVMVAMTLLLLGLLAVVSQWPIGARMAWHSEWQTEASTLAERTLEMLDAGVYPPSPGSATDGRYLISWMVTRGPVLNTMLATVLVRWTWGGRPYQVRMATVLSAEL